jgi:hypothetical protein
VRHGQLAEQDGVKDTEDSGVGADAERQADGGDGGESGAAQEGARAVTDVPPKHRHAALTEHGSPANLHQH